MKTLATYSTSTGEIVNLCVCPDDARPIAPSGHAIIECDLTRIDTRRYVKDGKIAERIERPGREFEWDGARWVPDLDRLGRSVRRERDERLAQCDWTDTASAPARLGPEAYGAWQAYRQALRDITGQPGFPVDITWPVAP